MCIRDRLNGKEWLFVLIVNGNIKSCEMEIIQSVSSLATSEHIPKGIIPTVENTENIITDVYKRQVAGC